MPYSGVSTAVVALAGDIDLVMGAPSAIMPLVERGVLPPVQTGARTRAVLPDLPTLREAGPMWAGHPLRLFRAEGTDAAVLDRWASLILEGGADPAFVEAMHRAYSDVRLPGFRASSRRRMPRRHVSANSTCVDAAMRQRRPLYRRRMLRPLV